MKHVLTFAIASLIVAFYFTPLFCLRFLWTFRWSDKYDGLNIYKLHNRNYRNLVKKIKG